MDKENSILSREVAKFGLAGGIGGMLGLYSVAKRLPNNTYESIIKIKASPQDVLKTAFITLGELGQVIENPETATELPKYLCLNRIRLFQYEPYFSKGRCQIY